MIGEWLFRAWHDPLVSMGFVWNRECGPGFRGARFYHGAWRQIKSRSSNMDTLVALGSTTAFAYSAWALFSGLGAHLYFMEAAAIITLISAGHWMESRVSVRASSALRNY